MPKILIIKIAAMGDFLLSTPAIRALKNSPNNSGIYLVAGQSIREVVEKSSLFDDVFWINDRTIFHGSFIKKVAELIRISWVVRRQKFDVGFNFHRDWRYNLILLLGGVKIRIGFENGKSYFLTRKVKISGIRHHIFHYCALISVLKLSCLDVRLHFPLNEEEEQSAEEKFLLSRNLKDYLVIIPGGASNVKEEMDSRRWPVEMFSELINLLTRNYQVILVGGKDDCRFSSQIKRECPKVIDFCGLTTLSEAAVLIKRSRLVITADNGLMHLASATGAKIIALFGPTQPEEKRPLGIYNRYVWKPAACPQTPCYKDGIFPICEEKSCLRAITPQEVFQIAKEILGDA